MKSFTLRTVAFGGDGRMTMGDEKKHDRVNQLHEKAVAHVERAYRAYQEWLLADCRLKKCPLDVGSKDTFLDWLKEECEL